MLLYQGALLPPVNSYREGQRAAHPLVYHSSFASLSLNFPHV